MNISGIRPKAEIYDYKIAKERERSELTAQQAQKLQAEETGTDFDGQKVRTETELSYAQKYELGKDYEKKGSECSLEELDREQVISDRKKEQLLRQYQFFVGTSQREKESATDKRISI